MVVSVESSLSETKQIKSAIIFVDGSAKGNPGPSSGAYLIIDESGKEIERKGFKLGEGTNNRAEYLALLKALERADELGIENVEVRSDSELLVNQINSVYRVKSKNLIELHKKVKDKIKRFKNFKIVHIPREQNSLVDKLARDALK